MATSLIDEQLSDPDEIDRFSNLPDTLLVSILSILPTRIAARTSVLSHRFCHLWEASSSLDLISRDLPPPKSHNFAAMADRALLLRNPSHPLLSLRLDVSGYVGFHESFFSSLLVKAASLGLRHLAIECCNSWDLVHSIPIIFSIDSLESLSVIPTLKPLPSPHEEYRFPSGITLTHLKSLSLSLIDLDPARLNNLLSELCSLEDLHLQLCATDTISISSQSIRKLELIIVVGYPNFHTVGLSIPSLESLCLETHGPLQSLPRIHGAIPLLRKAVINLHELHERDVSAVAGLLNCISHVEVLSLNIKESEDEMFPFPILLQPGKDPPKFSNLKHLDVTMCFHEHNFGAVVTLLHHSSALESLKLVHEIPKFTYRARGRSRKDWASKLPCGAVDDCCYAYFKNLYLGENG
ncbi:putative F-box protein At3g44060 [Carex rostrata]